MILLGLDLSVTSTGYSVINTMDTIPKKTPNISNQKYKVLDYGKIITKASDYKDEEDKRIMYITDRIKEVIKKHNNIDVVAIEGQFISPRASTVLVLRKLLGSVCRMVYHECNLNIEYVSPKSVKKCITGKGNADKGTVANTIIENIINIGEYSDKTGKKKTSDIYDSIGVAITIFNLKGSKIV